MARTGTRVARLERVRRPMERRARIVTADVWRWPEEARAALASCEAGDRETQASLVEHDEGMRPRFGGPRVSLILAWLPESATGSDRA